MSKRNSGITKRVETWTLNRGTKTEKGIVKIAVRQSNGQFHGSTNFGQKS